MKLINTIVTYLRSSVAELKKVTWPSRPDTIRYGVLVVAISASLAGFFVLLDSGLTRLVEAGLASRQNTSASEEQKPTEQPQVEVTSSTVTPVLDFSEPKAETTPKQ
ncbi:MAG: preprotein translocase subunit SecE [Patescibacteria group bacterium]